MAHPPRSGKSIVKKRHVERKKTLRCLRERRKIKRDRVKKIERREGRERRILIFREKVYNFLTKIKGGLF